VDPPETVIVLVSTVPFGVDEVTVSPLPMDEPFRMMGLSFQVGFAAE
jgi:hypothetical protein